MNIEEKLDKLREILDGYGKILVALSGGVDSTFLIAFAQKHWGDNRILAVTATGPHFAKDETDYARKICERMGVSHKSVDVSQVIETIKDNPKDRCYYCKREIFGSLKEMASITGYVLADGTNMDDMNDYRPGHRALEELGVSSPLKEAGLTKQEIRDSLETLAKEDAAIASALEMEILIGGSKEKIWSKPAFACLASRIPYGETITEEKLEIIYKAEVILHELGFSQERVRCHELGSGLMARIEVLPDKIQDAASMAPVINGKLCDCGFDIVALDLGGYQMGKLNNFIEAEASK